MSEAIPGWDRFPRARTYTQRGTVLINSLINQSINHPSINLHELLLVLQPQCVTTAANLLSKAFRLTSSANIHLSFFKVAWLRLQDCRKSCPANPFFISRTFIYHSVHCVNVKSKSISPRQLILEFVFAAFCTGINQTANGSALLHNHTVQFKFNNAFI